MPRRWLSLRSRQQESKNVTPLSEDHQFDFDFSCPSAFASPTSPTFTTFSMFCGPSRSKKIKGSPTRPRTADASRQSFDKRLQLTKVEDSWIGVAFGSPTHPPATCPSLTGNDSAISLHHAFRNEGPLPPSPPMAGKRRKLGNPFKFRTPPPVGMTISVPINVVKIDGEQERETTAQLMRNLPDLPPKCESEPDEVSDDNPPDDNDEPVYQPAPLHTRSASRDRLPRLEIQIPSVELDRYSVMFRDVSGIKPSSLLERRSRNLSNLKLANKTDEDIPPVPPIKPPAQRTVTPTTPKARSSYSLFPTPPKVSHKANPSTDRNLPRVELSYSARDRSSSLQSSSSQERPSTKPIEHHTPIREKESELSFTSPDDTIASSDRDDAPWRSDSPCSMPSSRTSMGSELFFDLKPFRESLGDDQAEYIIHKPDTPEVQQAARSQKARKTKLSKEKLDCPADLLPDLQGAEHMLRTEDEWRLSLQLNQAIADIERMTSPSNSASPPGEMTSPEIFQPKLTYSELVPAIRLRKRLDGLAIGIPSPITERTEISPRSTAGGKFSPPHFSRPHIAAYSVKPAPLNVERERQIARSSEAFFDVPPPVPKKDKKYLPVSKYSTGGSPSRVPDQQAARRKPNRAVTDSLVIAKMTKSVQPQSAERANSLSLTANKIPEILTPGPRKKIESGVVAIAVAPTVDTRKASRASATRQHSSQTLLPRGASKTGQSLKAESSEGVVRDQRLLVRQIHEVANGHKPGASMDLVVETVS